MNYASGESKYGSGFFGNKRFVIPAFIAIFVVGVIAGLLLKGDNDSVPGERGKSIDADASVLFWTCSMHPNIHKEGAGKCPICGMDLIPVSSTPGDKETGSMRRLVISSAARELMRIETTPVERRYATAEIRLVGKVEYDETRLGYITAWISGRLDRLYVDYTGVEVKKNDHMVYIYSPELYSTQDELIQVLKHARGQKGVSSIYPDVANLLGPVRERLRLWGMTQEQIGEIEKSKIPSDHLTIYSPMSGIVIKKNRQEGDYVNVGDRIYTVADLSHLWVMLDAYESDLVWLRYGQEVVFTTEAYPGEKFKGRIAFIEPVLNEKTRTVKVRVNVPNLSRKLKPKMFVSGVIFTQISTGGKVVDPHLAGKWICPMHPAVIKDEAGECDNCSMPLVRAESLGYVVANSKEKYKPLVIPVTAALVTGHRAIVYVEVQDTDQPVYEGREVVLGPRAGGYYLVRSGLKEGEIVVTNGNFKIDSAVQIKARPSMMAPDAGGGVGSHQHEGEGKAPGHKKPAETVSTHIPDNFLRQMGALEDGYDTISRAVELEDSDLIRSGFQAFGKALNKVDVEPLAGHLLMLWNELSMLMNNNAVEGSEVKKFEEGYRVFKRLQKNMLRLRKGFGIGRGQHKSPSSAHSDDKDNSLGEQRGKLWEAYVSLQQSLASDSVDLAREGVVKLQKAISGADDVGLDKKTAITWQKESSSLGKAVKSLKTASDLSSLREGFSLLSDEFVMFLKTSGSGGADAVYELHCPMALGGKGAVWLQEEKQVKNPYLGTSMLECADRVEKISGREASSIQGEHHHE